MKLELFPYQQDAADSAVAVFSHLAGQLDKLTGTSEKHAAERRAAIAHNGALLLEAPTGSGKTLLASDIAARTSLAGKAVWLWFAPFKGLVAQTASFLRSHEARLRFRNLAEDRDIASTKPGDVWVTTWQSVAANDADSRKILAGDETMPGLVAMIAGIRARGLRLGVLVDEAHHGFGHKTLALDLYARLAPEFTLLASATPNDHDAAAYKDRGGFARLERIRIRREDAVAAGLVKPGVRSVVFIPKDAASDRLADFDDAAIRHGYDRHKRIREGLRTHGVNLTPLMFVQVGSEKDAVERAKATLLRLGLPESAIATYTAEEPDANLLSLAADEAKEVLVFKMAVALGFDAPRAQTLVSLRSVNAVDFGTQLIGRLMRVHSRARAKSLSGDLPEWLRVAYVFLAERDSQAGLVAAANRVNILDGKLAAVCPHTVIAVVGDEVGLQVVKDGQPRLIPTESELPPVCRPNDSTDAASDSDSSAGAPVDAASDPDDWWGDASPADAKPRAAAKSGPVASSVAKPASYRIRDDIPRTLRVVRQKPAADFEKTIVAKVRFDDSALKDGRRAWLHYNQQESELLAQGGVSESKEVKVKLDRQRIAVLVQQEFFTRDETVDCKRLRELLLRKLKDCYEKAGDPLADNADAIEEALDLILESSPRRLKDAKKAALAQTTEAADALAPLPAEYTPSGIVTPSAKNIYGVFPEDLNTWERPFAELLDTEDSVLWWHRNPVRKDWSVAVLMQNGSNSYPDFVIALKERPTRDHILLLDTKQAINDDAHMVDKVKVVHPDYGKTLFVTKDADGRWVTVVYDEKLEHNRPEAPLRIADLAHGV